jgi:hypothetical protein
MAIKTVIGSAGIVSTKDASGVVIEQNGANSGFLPYGGAATSTQTANVTLTVANAGLTLLSASQGVLTATMPSCADAIGSMFVLRTTSPSAHVLTASSTDAGTRTFCVNPVAPITSTYVAAGSKLVMANVAGSSVALFSDGVSWLVLSASGSVALSGK